MKKFFTLFVGTLKPFRYSHDVVDMLTGCSFHVLVCLIVFQTLLLVHLTTALTAMERSTSIMEPRTGLKTRIDRCKIFPFIPVVLSFIVLIICIDVHIMEPRMGLKTHIDRCDTFSFAVC